MKKQTKLQMDPLDYLLEVINDADAEPARKDRLALAALPYCRARIGDRRDTKKDQRQHRLRKIAAKDNGGWRKDISHVAQT